MAEVKALLRRSGRDVCGVENCGMDAERVFRSVEDIPDDAGYFSLIVARERMM
jgi:precorrin-2/cobalt-factor-2 C20-methyltransferase